MSIRKKLREIFPAGYRDLEKRYRDLEQQNKKLYQELQKQVPKEIEACVKRELERREDWEKRKLETAYLAKGRLVWLIKCPAPDHERKAKWGDYIYALSLKKYLERLGIYVEIDLREDWNREADADVVLVLRGLHFYRPDRRNGKCVYIMWNISHPEMVTKEEYQLYDVVCIGSRHYAKKLKQEIDIPVVAMQQCTDTELFCPEGEKDAPCLDQWLFVGNSRGVMRSAVKYSIEEKLPLYMVGGNWKTVMPEHMDMVREPFIQNDDLPRYYRAAKVTLNDHWEDMLEYQFVNNRIFDALACGLPVVTDHCEEISEIFSKGVLYYRNQEEFRQCVKKVEESYEELAQGAKEQRALICEKYSFEARAKELVEIADHIKRTSDRRL
ncbi:MAG: glycosyltransferase [Eubacteriales bacterium]|nr:glycosyltransferase [Eubacteriales bacterium]